jgi:DHA1 family inner membrane transport protein
MPLGLLALALGGFGIGLTEFVILGLLPDVAGDFGVSEATAGWLVSGYALAVAVGGITITAAVTRLDRRRVLLGLMVLFIAGNLLSAVAPSYGVLMLGRILSALCHGAFFGIGAVVAADLVAPDRRAGAIAIMFGGLTIANVLGVPFGTLLGQGLGWRATFWAVAAIGVVAFAALAALVPAGAGARRTAGATSLREEVGAFGDAQVWLSLAVTVLGWGGLFGAFTYIAYVLTHVSGFAEGAVPWLLVVFGAGMFAGNWVGGRATDRAPARTMFTALAALLAVLAFFALTAGSPVLTVVSLLLMGATGFAAVPGLQMRVMEYAGQAPTLASGTNIAAFNLGNALGAWLGGLTIAAGLGYRAPIWAGAGMTAAGLIVLVVAERAAAGRRVRTQAATAAGVL